MLLVRRTRLLLLLVMIVVTPVIALPWSVLGKTIAQQQEDDDDDGDYGEKVAACASWLQQGRTPRLPGPRRPAAERPPQRLIASRKLPLRSVASPCSDLQSTRVRLQI